MYSIKLACTVASSELLIGSPLIEAKNQDVAKLQMGYQLRQGSILRQFFCLFHQFDDDAKLYKTSASQL